MIKPEIIKIYQNFISKNYFLSSLLIGALLNMAFPPIFMIFIIPIIICSLIYLSLNCHSKIAAFKIGWLFAFGHFLICFCWVFYALWLKNSDVIINIILFIIVLFLYSIIYGVFFTLVFMTRGYPKITSLSIFTILWGICELWRSYFIIPTPWNLIGYSFGFSDILMQTTSIFGIYGLGIIIIFLSSLLYLNHRQANFSAILIFLSLIAFGIFNLNNHKIFI